MADATNKSLATHTTIPDSDLTAHKAIRRHTERPGGKLAALQRPVFHPPVKLSGRNKAVLAEGRLRHIHQ